MKNLSLECSKKYTIIVFGKKFIIKSRKDIYKALDYRDSLIAERKAKEK